MRIFQNFNYDFLGIRKKSYMVSFGLLLIGIIGFIVNGFNFGVDFKGGSEIVLQYEKPIEISSIRNYMSNIGLGNVEVKTFGGETGVMIRTELQSIPDQLYPKVKAGLETEIDRVLLNVPRQIIDSTYNSITYSFENADTADQILEALTAAGFQPSKVSEEPGNRQIIISIGISDWIKENLRAKIANNNFIILKEDRVGPKIGDELKRDAVLALFFSLIAILIYIGFRFKFIFAFGSVIALFYNVIVTLGIFSVLYNVIPGLNLEIDLNIVAAFLTLIGYSINDTIVVFDRIRENMKIHKTRSLFDLINTSLSQTMSRTVLTGGSVLLTLIVLLFFGGEVLRSFAFTLFVGIVVGTYSSVFVASMLVYEYATKYHKKVEF